MRCTATAAATAAVAVLLAACGAGGGQARGSGSADRSAHAAGHATGAPVSGSRTLPGVGVAMSAKVPASARQAVVVRGDGPASADSTVTVFTRTGGLWHRGPGWPAHNGSRGWTPDHHESDGRSPVGVFTLHDAGGVLPDPGTALPYHQSRSFAPPAYWRPDYQHDFDYVIAIDYNRVVGTSPNDPTRPEGESKGGSIWLHLDHGSGSSACVTLPKDAMRDLLRTLLPADHPVIVMGDAARLAD